MSYINIYASLPDQDYHAKYTSRTKPKIMISTVNYTILLWLSAKAA